MPHAPAAGYDRISASCFLILHPREYNVDTRRHTRSSSGSARINIIVIWKLSIYTTAVYLLERRMAHEVSIRLAALSDGHARKWPIQNLSFTDGRHNDQRKCRAQVSLAIVGARQTENRSSRATRCRSFVVHELNSLGLHEFLRVFRQSDRIIGAITNSDMPCSALRMI